jgi:anti-sigma-K factor RskA
MEQVPLDLKVLEILISERDRQYHQKFEDLEKAIAIALTSAKEASKDALNAASVAVQKAEVANEKRFDSINEFRSTLADQQRTLLPRSEAEVRFISLAERVELLQKMQDRKSGVDDGHKEKSNDSKSMWAIVIAATGIVVALVTVIFQIMHRSNGA